MNKSKAFNENSSDVTHTSEQTIDSAKWSCNTSDIQGKFFKKDAVCAHNLVSDNFLLLNWVISMYSSSENHREMNSFKGFVCRDHSSLTSISKSGSENRRHSSR